jgi:hypothetical protein
MEETKAAVEQSHETSTESTSLPEQLAAEAVEAQKQREQPEISARQWGEIRKLLMTRKLDRVPECGHRFDRFNEPGNNCEYCWWMFFSSHGELVQTTDKAFQEQGKDFVVKMRGQKYLKFFLRFMSTMARFQKEAEALRAEVEAARPGHVSTEDVRHCIAGTCQCDERKAAQEKDEQARKTEGDREDGSSAGQAI